MNEGGSTPPARNDKVQLGCGTLILIALIVMIFSGNGDVRQLEGQIRALQDEVRLLRETIEEQSSSQQTNAPTSNIEPAVTNPDL